MTYERIQEGYVSLGGTDFAYAKPWKWWLSYGLRAAQGAFGLFVSFLLIIQSDRTFDLLLNFTGIAFVSELDDLAFFLANRQFFGSKIQEEAQEIITKRYQVSKTGRSTYWKRCSRGFLLLLVAIWIFVGFAIVWRKQASNSFLCTNIYVEFSDSVVPSLGTHTGQYHINNGKDVVNSPGGRSSYYETRGRDDGGGSDRGLLGYCQDENVWTFSSSQETADPCDKYLAKSSVTDTFDVLDTSSQPWYSRDGIPLDVVQLSCPKVEASSRHRCDPGTFPASGRGGCRVACERLEILESSGFASDGGARAWSTYYEMLIDSGVNVAPISAYEHPIYWGVSQPSAIDLVLFTGRRWVLTDSSQIRGIHNSTDMGSVTEFFQNDLFHASEISFSNSSRPVAFISETVNAANDPLSPTGLRWYHAFYSSDRSTIQEFPSADVTRPSDAVFSCTVCNDDTNPCLYEGTCDAATGTCSCNHGATGNLCEIRPIGNGECDTFFNNEAHAYDGGDCCGGSCDSPACNELLNASRYGDCVSPGVRGYPNCVDPEMIPLSINLNFTNMWASIELTCDQKRYFFAPTGVDCPFPLVPPHRELIEEVVVSDGADCRLVFGYKGSGTLLGYYSLEIIYGVGTKLEHSIGSLGPVVDVPRLSETNWTYAVRIPVLWSCLLEQAMEELQFDLDVLSEIATEVSAIYWMDNFVKEGTVCGSNNFDQQYAVAVMSFSGWFEPSRYCENTNIVRCNAEGSVLSITAETSSSSLGKF